MTTATRSRIAYRAFWKDYLIGVADDRYEADDLIYAHANRCHLEITDDYRVVVKLREEGD